MNKYDHILCSNFHFFKTGVLLLQMNIYKFIYLIPVKFKVVFSLDWEVLEKRRVGVKVFAGFVV